MAVRCALLVIGPKDDPNPDEAADAVRACLGEAVAGLFFVEERRTASDRHLIEEIVRRWCDEEEMDLVLTVGATFPAPGHSGDEIAPEAVASVIERGMPSLPEAMRAYAAEEEPLALLDRSVAGIRARTLVLNLPGETILARLFAEAIGDLIGPIVDRLQPAPNGALLAPAEPAAQTEDLPRPKATGLNAAEFAAFLAARQGRETEE